MADRPSDISSDLDLLDRFRHGDQDAAIQLYYRYSERLLQLAERNTSQLMASRFDPEDVVQSVFRTFFRRASTGQYEAPEGDELWKLLLVIALNKVRSQAAYHRANKRDVRRTQSMPNSDENGANSAGSQEIAKSILSMSIEELIQNQPESHRGIIRLRVEGEDIQSIAEKEKRSKRTVERVLQSFRKQLLDSALLASGESPS